jgi:predicted enzyme related to lactoylglutathione lyase
VAARRCLKVTFFQYRAAAGFVASDRGNGGDLMTGELTHIELGAPDAKKARAFFGPLFGWTFELFDDGDQAIIHTPTTRGGLHDGVTSTTLTAYFKVDDIGDAVTKVRELGGYAEDPSPEQPGFGRFATCTDDQGIPFGLHQP